MSTYFFWCFLVIANVIATDFNWLAALDELQQTQAKWDTTTVNSYVFKLTITSPILQVPCNIAPKYVLVNNHVVEYVEYDSQYLNSQNVNCHEHPINMAQYDTIDGYYNMAINWAIEGILDNCNSSAPSTGVPAQTCGGSILFEYNQVLFYPTKLRFILPQVGNQYPLYTISCLTVYNSSTHIQNFGHECIDFIPPQPIPCTEQCKPTQDECGMNDKCCHGFCGISQWDTSKLVCCNDDSVEGKLCRNDFDCCNGYECDDDTNLCIERTKVICGIPRNSGRNKLVQCKLDDECCDGYKCNERIRKCVPRYNYDSIFNWFRLDEFSETKIYWLLMNICIVMLYWFYNKMCRKSKRKHLCMDELENKKIEIEKI